MLFPSLFSCHNETTTIQNKTASSAMRSTPVYPFTAKSSLNWRPGDENNAALVLDCLKKYVNGDIKGCTDYFADTAEFISDRFYLRGGRDSLRLIIADMRGASDKVSKNFDTWLIRYYPDQDETKVTLWYTEIMTDHKGKTDSIYYTDDVTIKNGKILVYDEKQRQFPDAIAK
jgi:hypothetical protein